MKTMAIAYTPPLFSPSLNVNLTRLSSSLLLPFCHSSFSLTLSRCRRRPRFLSMASPTQSSNQAVSTGDVNTDADVFQLIRTHQENAARLPPVEEIRTLLNQSTRGMLSTFSQKHEGYPSGSMVDFACDADGSPILAVSSLAVHTKERDRFYCEVLSDYSTLCSICGRTSPSCKAVFGHMMRGHPKQRVFSTDLRRKKKKVSSRIYRDRLVAKNPPPLNPETETLQERHKDPTGVTIYINT